MRNTAAYACRSLAVAIDREAASIAKGQFSDEELRAAIAEGQSRGEIAQRFNVTYQRVDMRCRKLGLVAAAAADRPFLRIKQVPHGNTAASGKRLPQSELQERLAAETDFCRACDITRATLRSIAASTGQEARQRPGVPCDPKWWRDQAERAERARLLYMAYMDKAKAAVIDRYQREGLGEYMEALETGNFALLGV